MLLFMDRIFKLRNKGTSKTIFNNVHFLHLEFNTLPENKQWIPGCQCEYCYQ